VTLGTCELAGLFLWSISLVSDGRDLAGGVVFAALLNMKHLFACAAPVYFVYLLRHYCTGTRAAAKFLLLGGAVAAVFGVSFGPFVAMGQLRQARSRPTVPVAARMMCGFRFCHGCVAACASGWAHAIDGVAAPP
jgi:ALG6, ALG8 glycosyltransferase family